MAKTKQQKHDEEILEKELAIKKLKAELEDAKSRNKSQESDISLLKAQMSQVMGMAKDEGVDVEVERVKPTDLVKVKVLRGKETFCNWQGVWKTYNVGDVIPDYTETLFVLAPAKKLKIVE